MNWKRLFLSKAALEKAEKEQPAVQQNERTGSASDRRKQRSGDNPFINWRRRYNDHTGPVLFARNMWMVAALLFGLIALSAVGGLIHIGSQSKYIPYVIEVDKLGKPLAYGPATQVEAVPARVIKAAVSSFLNDARLVTPDVALQRAAILRVYASLLPSDPAMGKMNDYLNGDPEENPFSRAKNVTVSIQIDSVLQQTAQTWQVEWVETIRDRKGMLVEEPFRMRSLVTTAIIVPTEDTSEEQLRKNPMGIYVTDFTWQKTL